MILYRAFAWNRLASVREAGGAIFFAGAYQGAGRHDNPERYAVLYAAAGELPAVVEQLAGFRGRALRPAMLTRRRLPLGLATIELDDGATLIDLDDPDVLAREELRPSRVATHERELTQAYALELFGRHPGAAGLRWWSTFESLWTNFTIFDRVASELRLLEVRPLEVEDPAVVAAAEYLDLG